LNETKEHRMRVTASAFAAGLLLAASAGGAAAQSAPALVISDLHHRAGPTSNSPSYGVIPGGTTIEAGPCGGGWCQAFLSGNMGYVSERYLDFGGPPPRGYYAAPPPPPPPPPVYAPPPYYMPAPPPPYYHDWRSSRRWR
jgi:uncharacterized protein YraI